MSTDNPAPTTLGALFTRLSPKHKLFAFVAAFVVGCLLVAASGAISYRIAYKGYTKKEAARMKQVQDALALADAADKRADAKEQEAARIKETYEAKAKITTTEKQQLESEAKSHDEQITNAYQHDKDFIDSDMSGCQRCRDICARLDAVAVSNPDLAKYKCDAESCAEQCDPAAN